MNNVHRQMAGKITGPIRLSKQNCAKGTGMSVPAGWDEKGEYLGTVAHLFRKISGRTALFNCIQIG